MKQLIFICPTIICRSTACEVLLRGILQQRKMDNIIVCSAGTDDIEDGYIFS